ncbi:MAG: hypothetical protein HGB12_13420 [Bacteroidetes bacterium]|nr:hypothetical protein [Bacteroidota bacterium]
MTDNNQEKIINKNNDSNDIDILTEIVKISHYWKFFVISVFISLIIAFLYNRYNPPIYKATCKIIVKDNAKSTTNNLLEEFNLFGNKTNIINEIGILKSKSLSRKTVNDLKLYISYLRPTDKLNRTVEIYKNCPFVVEIDSNHIQLLENTVYIQIISKDKYKLEIKNIQENPTYFDFKKQNFEYLNPIIGKNDITRVLKFGEQFNDQNYSFRIKLNTEFKNEINFEKVYQFVIEDPLTLGANFASYIEVSPIEKDASILEISLKSNVTQKAIDFLNKLSENYINSGLEEKNTTAFNTLNFIDNQLSGITDSLTLVENVLENFRSENKIISISDESKLAFDKITEQDKSKALQNIEIRYYEYILDYLKANNDFADIVAPATMGITNSSMNLLVT